MRKEAKNGFPNVALEGVDNRRPNLVSKRERTVERRGKREKKRRGRRRREEEEEEIKQKGKELYGFVWNYMEF